MPVRRKARGSAPRTEVLKQPGFPAELRRLTRPVSMPYLNGIKAYMLATGVRCCCLACDYEISVDWRKRPAPARLFECGTRILRPIHGRDARAT